MLPRQRPVSLVTPLPTPAAGSRTLDFSSVSGCRLHRTGRHVPLSNAARVLGPGRAGRSLATALSRRGWRVDLLGRDDPTEAAANGVDVVVIAVPDDAIADVAASVRPDPDTVVVHLAGSRGLDVLAPHPRVASMHPLVSLPDPETGAERLLSGVTFAVAGDVIARRLVGDLGGRAIEVSDDRRPLYHATAVVAANHVVALLAQVERLAVAAGVPRDTYWPLVATTVDNVAHLGPAAALTGPAARGDADTIQAHLRALPDEERALYRLLAGEAARLAGRDLPLLCEGAAP